MIDKSWRWIFSRPLLSDKASKLLERQKAGDVAVGNLLGLFL